jgi:hypothetical protein
MKKQALKAVTMLISIIALAFMTAVVSNAQSGSTQLRANVPFDFVVGDKTLAAGEYRIGQATSTANEAIAVRGADNHQNAIRLTNIVEANAPKDRGMLVFHRYGDNYYLSEIWMPGSAEGRQLLKSKAEKATEQELAKNPASGEVARNFEIVTVYATIR